MKKWNKQWAIRLGAVSLAVVCLGAGAALAASGDQNDPLVTLSYLNQTAIPQVVKQVEESAAIRQKELEQSFAGQIDQYKREAGQGGTGSSEAASYTVITLNQGQVMTLDIGCEVLLRVGTATVKAADGGIALIDLSTGGTVNGGTSLTKNHLYMASLTDRTVTATAGTVKLLVRGGYTLS